MAQKFTKQTDIEHDFLMCWNQIQKSNPDFRHPYAIKRKTQLIFCYIFWEIEHKTQLIFCYILWEIEHKTQNTMNKTPYFHKPMSDSHGYFLFLANIGRN